MEDTNMVDENQVEMYVKAVKIKALKYYNQHGADLVHKYHNYAHLADREELAQKDALKIAFADFCGEKATTYHGSIGDKSRLYDTLAEVAIKLGIEMPL